MTVKTIKGSIANEIMFDDEAHVEILDIEMVDERRSSFVYRKVFKIRGEFGFYALETQEPKNADQGYNTFDIDVDVPVRLVRPKVVNAIVYEEVPESG